MRTNSKRPIQLLYCNTCPYRYRSNRLHNRCLKKKLRIRLGLRCESTIRIFFIHIVCLFTHYSVFLHAQSITIARIDSTNIHMVWRDRFYLCMKNMALERRRFNCCYKINMNTTLILMAVGSISLWNN